MKNISTSRMKQACLAMAGMLLSASGVFAASLDDFEASPAMNIFKGEERGMSLVVTDSTHGKGKVACWTWKAPHESFQEAYYAKDVAVPATGETLDGTITIRVYAESAQGLWMLGLRLKDGKGEIFDFSKEVKLKDKDWTTVEFPVKSGLQKGSWGGQKTGTMEGTILLTGFTLLMDKAIPAGTLLMDDVSYVPGKAAAAAAPRYKLEDASLLEPFWVSAQVRGEAVLFIKETGKELATGMLLFEPKSILRVRDARTGTVYEAGKDFTQAGRELTLTTGSRIPFLTRDSLYKKPDEKQAIKHKAGDPQTWLYYQESGYPLKQVEVDYERAKGWDGFKPAYAGESLPRTLGKLKSREALKIVLVGDSISCGANASNNVPPYMPGYPELLRRQLEATFGSTVELANLAVGGSTSEGGVQKVSAILEAKPDLVIIAYGANDVAGRNPTWFSGNFKKIIEGVRAARPETEFILVSESLTNPEWNWAPVEEFPKYREAISALCGKGVALADVTSLSSDILKKKRYYDLTGNGVNHPNDYGHRLYAQVLLALLVNAKL